MRCEMQLIAAEPPDRGQGGSAGWSVRYLLLPSGVLWSPMVGSGSELLSGLDHGASRVIGIEREAKYIEIARRRIESGNATLFMVAFVALRVFRFSFDSLSTTGWTSTFVF